MVDAKIMFGVAIIGLVVNLILMKVLDGNEPDEPEDKDEIQVDEVTLNLNNL